MVGKIFAKIHGHLSGNYDFFFSGFILELVYLDAVVIGDSLLDKVYPNFSFNILDKILDD